MARDVELFKAAMADVTPLRRRKRPAVIATPKAVGSPTTQEKFDPLRAMPDVPADRPAVFDRDVDRALAKGKRRIEARLDLHGMTQDQAHGALSRFLRNAQGQGIKFVIVVTGKGLRGASGSERGVLKREVPRWLGMPEFRDLVVGFEVASIAHGGEGALYVRVRRGQM